MGSLERRIQQLEELFHMSEGAEVGDRGKERAELIEQIKRAREKAALEDEEGDPRRRLAIEELEEVIRRRQHGD